MPLPVNGIFSLQGHSRPGDTVHSKPKQAMIVRMSAETLEELESFPNQPLMEFEFGENPGIYIGEMFFPMRSLKEGTPHELYLRAPSAAKPMAPLKLCANVIGKFTVERELREKTQAQLRDRTREEEKLRRGHQTQWLETPPDLPATNGKKRKPPQASSMFRKPADHLRPNNVSASSSTPRPTSPLPPSQSVSTREGIAPVRKRLIQCLAVSERTADEVVKLVGGGDPDSSLRRDFMSLLDDVAEQTAPVKKSGDTSLRPWRLKTQTWLEVRPYEWPRLSETERTNMARNARMAFKHMNIPESDPAWAHVKYRAAAAPPLTAGNLPKSGANVHGPSKTGTGKAEAPKRGVLSKDAKEKKAQAKAESVRSKADVLMKDESKSAPMVSSTSANARAKGKEAVGEAETKGASTSSTNGIKPPARRGPGSGYRVSKSSSQDQGSRGGSASTDGANPSPAIQQPLDVRMKDREARAPLPAKPAPAIPSPMFNQDKKSAGPSTSVSRMKKVTEPAIGGFDSDRPPDKPDRDRGRERERETRRGDEEKFREKARDKEDASTGMKRKKPTREYDDTVPAGQKRRKTDESVLPITTISSREHEPRIRDLSLPKKPDVSVVPQRSKNQEPSPSPLPPQPMRTKVKKEREVSQTPSVASARPRAKREASPLPTARSSAISQAKGSSGSSQRPDYQIERSTKASGASSKARRRSPIYTSSEDEGDVRRPVKRDTASNPGPQVHASHKHAHSHRDSRRTGPRPSLPAPTDHAGLRARYSSSYLEYIASFQQVLAQKCKIENMLKAGNGSGSVASISDSDGELLDAEELVKLNDEYRVLKEELEGIQRLFARAAKGSSLSD